VLNESGRRAEAADAVSGSIVDIEVQVRGECPAREAARDTGDGRAGSWREAHDVNTSGSRVGGRQRNGQGLDGSCVYPRRRIQL